MIIVAKAHVYGDNIDTDRIIPGKYTKTLDISQLAQHVMEDLDPEFLQKFSPGEILVAGKNFGCGSSREQAPLALKAAGVSCIIAKFFARIFFRNAINLGLPVLEAPEHDIQHGDRLSVDIENGIVKNLTTGKVYACTRLNGVMKHILAEGGLVNYLKKYGDFVTD
ncbi:MAG: 3-isopropylmalate dehydratase small subunit [Chitinophagaceae bacterium]|nr:3-isopropylmalate dehydratase small subunit [Chitinophagaceae bacterium]